MFNIGLEERNQIIKHLQKIYSCEISFANENTNNRIRSARLMHRFSEQFDNALSQLLINVSELSNSPTFLCVVENLKVRNAVAERYAGVQVIEIFLPLIVDTLALSHSFSFLFDELFDYAGETKELKKYDFRFSQGEYTDGGIDIVRNPEGNAVKLADIVTYISIKWVLLHEAGHHRYKHLDQIHGGKLMERGNKLIKKLDYQKMEVEADLWATLQIMNDFEYFKRYIKRYTYKDITNLQTIKIIYLAILLPLLVLDEGITDENMKLVDHPPSMFRQVTITNAIVDFFNRAENKMTRPFIKDELLQLYAEHREKELFEDAQEYFGGKVDLSKEMSDGNPEIIRPLFSNWIMSIFSWVNFRFYDMMGGDYPQMIERSTKMINVIKGFSKEENEMLGSFDVSL